MSSHEERVALVREALPLRLLVRKTLPLANPVAERNLAVPAAGSNSLCLLGGGGETFLSG